MDCPFNPKFAFVVLEREKLVSSGGIIIPENVQKTNAKQQGRVVAVGPSVTDVALGELVIFGQFSGSWFTHKNRDFYFVHEEDVLSSISEE